MSEDCLFLDVLLPREIWERRQQNRVAVLVWIHGGGFDLGWKDESGRGYGLVTRSRKLGRGVILVSINYRLGIFVSLALALGWDEQRKTKIFQRTDEEIVGLDERRRRHHKCRFMGPALCSRMGPATHSFIWR